MFKCTNSGQGQIQEFLAAFLTLQKMFVKALYWIMGFPFFNQKNKNNNCNNAVLKFSPGRTDFTLVLKIRSLVFPQSLPGFVYPAFYTCICSSVCEMATLLSNWLKRSNMYRQDRLIANATHKEIVSSFYSQPACLSWDIACPYIVGLKVSCV